jgi:hypothetical protein
MHAAIQIDWHRIPLKNKDLIRLRSSGERPSDCKPVHISRLCETFRRTVMATSCQRLARRCNLHFCGRDLSSQVSRLGGGLFRRPGIRKDLRTLFMLLGGIFSPLVRLPLTSSELVVKDAFVKIRPEFREGIASHQSQESPQGAAKGIVGRGFAICPPGI